MDTANRFGEIKMAFRYKLSSAFIAVSLLYAGEVMTAGKLVALEDDRQLIKVDPQIKDRFLAEMRADLGHLNDLMTAIADGNMEETARIAERKMGLAHKRIEKMEQMGASDEQISQFIAKVRQMAENPDIDLSKQLHGRGKGRGIGQFMPEELRAMGQEMHKSAYNIADIARSVKNPPEADGYKKLFSALSDLTALCRSCHDTYRVR
jgi:cytochrome c556